MGQAGPPHILKPDESDAIWARKQENFAYQPMIVEGKCVLFW